MPNVTITVDEYHNNGISLKAIDFNGIVVSYALNFDSIFSQDSDLRVFSTQDPIYSEIPDDLEIPTSVLKRECKLLFSMKKESEDLYAERYATCDADRYKLLVNPRGPIRILEEKIMVQEFIVRVLVKVATGVWPSSFRGL